MPDDPHNPDSLGDDRTFVGEGDAPVKSEQSLGDEGTHGGGMDSSLSDLEFDGHAIDSDLPLIDLAARFEIEGELGQGGMGAVQLATDRQLKRKVAIKRILGPMASSPSALKRFVTEAQSIAALNHFNIVQIFEFGRDEEGPLLIMEYVSGGSLLDRLKEGKLEMEDTIGITCQLCDALTIAHEQGIIHRDIKPANILLTKRGEPKLTDFGLARQENVDHGQTQEGAVLGTLDFMPPEQRRDATAVDARSDLWSLAATCYQMLTGDVPRVIDLDAVPQNLRGTFSRALKQHPDERYATAEEFKTELRKAMAKVAAPVAVDLAAGVCPACNTANDASRKFCQNCAESLIAPCLSCSEEVAVWQNVCGQCGAKQDEQRERVKEQLANLIEESLTLARGHEYEKALARLGTVAEDSHDFTEDVRQQAAEQVTLVTAERDRQYQLRDELVELARQYHEANDYTAAIRELEKIPLPLRSGNRVAEQLSNAQAARDELSSLLQEIRNQVKNKQAEGLLEKTTRFLELDPEHSKARKLHEQLLQRRQKEENLAAELAKQAEQQYSQGLYEAVLTTMSNWPQSVPREHQHHEWERVSNHRLARVHELKEEIKTLIFASEKLPLVEELLKLRPQDKQVQEWTEQLREKAQAETVQLQKERKKRQTKRKIANTMKTWLLIGCFLALFFLFLFGALFFL